MWEVTVQAVRPGPNKVPDGIASLHQRGEWEKWKKHQASFNFVWFCVQFSYVVLCLWSQTGLKFCWRWKDFQLLNPRDMKLSCSLFRRSACPMTFWWSNLCIECVFDFFYTILCMQGLAFSLATLIAHVWWVCSFAYPAPVLNDLIRGVFPKRRQSPLQS